MATFTEVLPQTKSSQHSAMNWTPGEAPGSGLLTVHTDRASVRYAVAELPCGWDGRAFSFAKPEGETGTDKTAGRYEVFVGRNGQDRLCGCKGFSRFGHCKHT